jgi:predicted nucleic acid-binding protein
VRALADTSILIALVSPSQESPDLSEFDEVYVSSLSWSELAMGIRAGTDAVAVLRRQAEFTALREMFGSSLPYDDACVAAYGRLLDRVVSRGGSPLSRPKALDRMIAATALANGMRLATRNPADVATLDGLVEVAVR